VLLSCHGSDESLLHSADSWANRISLAADMTTWLAEGMLASVDRMSMASSVEVRMPFLDLASGILMRASMPGLKGSLTRSGFAPLRTGSRKQSRPPLLTSLDEWFQSEWRTLARDVLLSKRSMQRGWWDERSTRTMLEEHFSGERAHSSRIYQLIILELWARAILDRGEVPSAPAEVTDCVRELPADRSITKIAVVAPGGIGDTMRLTPALRKLANADRDASVTLYTARGCGSDEVMAGMAPVDRHVPIGFQDKGVGKAIEFVKHIRRSAPARLVSAWVSTLAGIAGFLSGVKRRSGWAPQWSRLMRTSGMFWPEKVPYDPPRRDPGAYDILAFARLLGVELTEESSMTLAPPIWEEEALRAARAELTAMSRPHLVVSAAAKANIPQRQYPINMMAGVLEQLLASEQIGTFIFVGDQAAAQTQAPLVGVAGERGLNLCGKLSLSSAAAIIRACDAALMVDGGLLHVALATEIPVVALYGPTEVFSSDPRPLQGKYTALSAFESCRCICMPHRGIEAGESCMEEAQCLRTISPDAVADAVISLLRAESA